LWREEKEEKAGAKMRKLGDCSHSIMEVKKKQLKKQGNLTVNS